MNKIIKEEIEFAGKKITLETGELALRADMAVKATYGDTVLLATVVHGDPMPDADFLGLRVEYEEKLYASGSIKSSRFVKREGKPTDEAVITRRTIDHAIRPLFPKDFYDEVQVVMTVLSLDEDADPEFLAMVATSAALQASDVPCYGPMTTVRVGLVDDKFVVCPCLSDLEEKSDLDMIVSFVGEDQRFLACEAEANVLPEEKILEGINFARDNVSPILDLVTNFAEKVNPKGEKYEYESKALPQEIVDAVNDLAEEKVKKILKDSLPIGEKQEKYDEIREEILTKYEGTYKKVDMLRAFDEIEKKVVRNLVLEDEKRLDGRGLKDVRPISSKVGILPRTHGSGLFTRGTTQALTVCTLGSPSEELLIQDMYGERKKRYLHYYNFPPYSVGEIGRFGGPKGREIGHGMIAEKALRPLIPSQEDFPYTIMLVSEIVSSNGSSSMAATCGSTLALMDAGVPLKDMVGGIALGLVVEDDSFSKYKILTDIAGEEDAGGYMDFKMTGTKDGVTAIQCDIKVKGIPMNVLSEIVKQSREARIHVLDEMKKTISSSRESVSEYAPKMVTINIDPDKIGLIIGAGGKTIREIQEKTGTEIAVEEDGKVIISSSNIEKATEALEIVKNMVRELKPGEVLDGEVKEILDFGALVEVLPGKVGLLHVSEIANEYVENVRDFLNVGDKVKVKVLSVERDGKISLSKKALLPGGESQGNGKRGNGRDDGRDNSHFRRNRR